MLVSLMGENERALPPAEGCGSSWQGGTLQWEQIRDGHLEGTHLHLGKKIVWALSEPMCA